MSKALTDHDEIRNWVSAHAGNPTMTEVPDGHGGSTPVLQLSFGQRLFAADNDEARDQLGGIQQVTWVEWFEAFDREKLALRVATPEDDWDEAGYEIEKREPPEA